MLREHFEHVVKTSGLRDACTGTQENHCSLECHCGFGTPDGIERAEACEWEEEASGPPETER